MTLQHGTRLGSYQIESPIGAGGMGEVYKAADTGYRLPRDGGRLRAHPDHRLGPRPMIETWRHLALYLLLLGSIGVALELLLLEHFEDPWQWAPIALLGTGVLLGAAVTFRPSRYFVRALQALMLLYLVAGGLGMFFHLKANVEFELELRPSMAGTELIMETLKGAMPALAPGAMVQLGLLGLLALYRHPSLTERELDGESRT